MYERKKQELAPFKTFWKRVGKSAVISLGVLGVSLGVGMAGYHWICALNWIDSFLNASMILTGMGPVAVITSFWGKFFAGSYAIFSGVAFLSMASIMLGPFFHRFLHVFHLDSE